MLVMGGKDPATMCSTMPERCSSRMQKPCCRYSDEIVMVARVGREGEMRRGM